MATLYKSALLGTFLLTLILCFEGYAQTDAELFTAKNAVYVELGSNAGWYAASYGRIFHQKGMLKLSASAGFSIWRHNRSDQPYNTSKHFIGFLLFHWK